MSIIRPAQFCSELCEKAVKVRSFGECPECKRRWDSTMAGEGQHYRNNAWAICNTCSWAQNRCARCGKSMAG